MTRTIALAMLLCLVSGARADALPHTYSTAQASGCALVVLGDGTVFTSGYVGPNTCNRPQTAWSLAGTVGIGAGDAVVGVNTKGKVLTADGYEYQLFGDGACTSVGAVLVVNVFEHTGQAPTGDRFAGFGDSNNEHVYAVTEQGRLFRRNVRGCSEVTWEFVGALPLGPTNTTRPSWGALKLVYR